jgi:type II restriction/modification system DNA methylase subunit YeeA
MIKKTTLIHIIDTFFLAKKFQINSLANCKLPTANCQLPMNTNHLKKFARNARQKFLQQIAVKLEQVLQTDSVEMREKGRQIDQLAKQLHEKGKAALIEEVAYTWFNRLMALRFMDANGYTDMRVVSPAEGDTLPEILQEAKQGNVDEDLQLDRSRLSDLLDGKLPSDNPQNEVYKMLLVAECNRWHSKMPFMFQRIQDYTELLMPDDVLSEHSLVYDIREGMTEADCQNVEVIGWLYQFYIAERKDEVFAAKGKVKPSDIPAATQLFTPRWIVEYMVQNTLGKLWLQNKPNSQLKTEMPYFIESESSGATDFLKMEKAEEIRLLDPACGSGHILVYAFEVLAQIYEEQGYSASEIPNLILKNNLFGIEIDDRAASLAAFALMMKARSYYRRFFKKDPVQPQIISLQNIEFSEEELEAYLQKVPHNLFTDGLKATLLQFEEAKNFGALIQPKVASVAEVSAYLRKQDFQTDIFLNSTHQKVLLALRQAAILLPNYHLLVANPPYMGGGKMNSILSTWVKKNYPKSKDDLMVCFMERAWNQVYENGLIGMINLPSWMFLSSFEKFRKELIQITKIDTLLHLGRGIFGSDFGSVAFTLKKGNVEGKGVYRRLFKKHVQVRSVEKIRNIFFKKSYGFFKTNQKDFEKIPGSPIGYWVTDKLCEVFEKAVSFKTKADCIQGIITGNTNKFIRCWFEVVLEKVLIDKIQFIPEKYWVTYTKGGEVRRWYGNNLFVLNWAKEGEDLIRKRNTNSKYYLKPCLTWTLVTTSGFTARYCDAGFLWDVSGSIGFPKNEENALPLLGFLNTKLSSYILNIINPTINTNIENIEILPIYDVLVKKHSVQIKQIVYNTLQISKTEWNTRETSWDFQQNELLRQAAPTLQEAYEKYQIHWRQQFAQLHANEEALNQLFIEIYGLEEELTPEVALEDVTILKAELDRKALSGVGCEWSVGSLERFEWVESVLQFDDKEVLAQLVSYAVGCMMGRYSLDKAGLILANAGEDLKAYEKAVGKGASEWTFAPDDDGILPVLADDYFTDDVVGRFRAFLKAAFGEAHFEENLKFVSNILGGDMRKYFVRDFYKDHLRRYKKRPIYWLFSSPKKHFQALVYVHRYRSDTVSKLLNDYLREFIRKLEAQRETLVTITHKADTTTRDKNEARKTIDKIDVMLTDLRDYERRILYPLAARKLELDLDDGVLVNYNKMGEAVLTVSGLNDAKARKKVQGFEWVEFDWSE